MDSPDINLLVDMGFHRDRAVKAINLTGNKGVEAAMEWLLAHTEELENEALMESSAISGGTETAAETPTNAGSSLGAEAAGPGPSVNDAEGGQPAVAKSFRCEECEKLFRSSTEVEYHAAKSGHSRFSESTEEKKPLSEEERQSQMKLLEEKMKAKRKEREERQKQEELEREKTRIRTGKEITAAKKKLEDDEMKKVLEARKREKEEEKIARQRVREQIEADKAARRAKAAGETAKPEAQPAPPVPVSPPPQRDYSQTRLQRHISVQNISNANQPAVHPLYEAMFEIRLMNGSALTQTFSSKEQLSAVRLYVEMNRTDGDQPFSLMTSFPRKIFSTEDYEKPLDVLGLVPSAVIILIKPQEEKI